jgi:DNA-directed RNA polymerase delta subunit
MNNNNFKKEFNKINEIIKEIQKEVDIMEDKISNNNIDEIFHFYTTIIIDANLLERYMAKIAKMFLSKLN